MSKSKTLLLVPMGKYGKQYRYRILMGNGTGSELNFGTKILSAPVGKAVTCVQKDETQFGEFKYGNDEQQAFIDKHHSEDIEYWSVQERIRLEDAKIVSAGKKNPQSHIDGRVDGLVSALSHLTISEKLKFIQYLTAKILRK